MYGMRVLEENEYARILEDDCYYIIEDKTLINRPTIHRGITSTGIQIEVEFCMVGDKLEGKKFIIPKEGVPIKVIKNLFDNITKQRKKEWERLKELQQG